MKKILVDSSIWITYFRDKNAHAELDDYIKNNQICTNNLILSELIPFLEMKKRKDIVELLLEIENIHLNINWEYIINLQIQNLKNGINKVGIPDLIIVENVIYNNLLLFSEDKHFKLMQKHLALDLL